VESRTRSDAHRDSSSTSSNEEGGTPPDPGDETHGLSPRWSRRLVRWIAALVLLGLAAGVVYWESRTSRLQSLLFTDVASEAHWYVDQGRSPTIQYPEHGPYNNRLGYTMLPDMIDRAASKGFRVTRQARHSERFSTLTALGLHAPYRAKSRSGLSLTDPYDNTIHRSPYPVHSYESFEAIPELVYESLLFIENRSLLDPRAPRRNPALEPDRFLKALSEVALTEITGEGQPDGGSTLATQIEKFRYSPGGQTQGYTSKLQQMVSASLRTYMEGERTLEDQKEVVRTYLNAVPLSSVPGHGEVFGLGDGLEAWYGADFDRINTLLREASAIGTDSSQSRLRAKARALRMVLSLFVAQRRPSYYLREGRGELDAITDQYLEHLADAGLVSDHFVRLALESRPALQAWSDVQRPDASPRSKLNNALRTDLLELTGRQSLYALDRTDMRVQTTVDYDVQRSVKRFLKRLDDEAFLERHGLGPLEGDASEMVYSLTLYERTPSANVLRVQADTYDGPFNLNDGMKLNLGSTAKLRTTASYLQIVADLHERYADRSDDALDELHFDRRDRLSRWAVRYLEERESHSLAEMLHAALERRYSAEPGRFFTGGGIHHFSNFSYKYNDTYPTVRKGLKQSINLVFVRLMRDIVRYHMFRLPEVDSRILVDADHPKRDAYLARAVKHESLEYLREFFEKYRDHNQSEILVRLTADRYWNGDRLAAAFRSVMPEADIYTMNHFLEEQLETELEWPWVRELYETYGKERFDIADRAYVADVHPIELWVVRYLLHHPDPEWDRMVEASREARRISYEWLDDTEHKSAQDRRIRIELEREAFDRLHDQWKQLGYPFDELVPSYATALGSSADRPSALSTLMGIVVNDGRRLPEVRFESLHLAAHTPYETLLERMPREGKRVMRPAVAETLHGLLRGVVEEGTAESLGSHDLQVDGREWTLGGKTGTGDNRHEIVGRSGHVVRSIPLNRTGTFTFILDDRFFGALTAYVSGRQSGEYEFTSHLAVSILGELAPRLKPLWWRKHQPDPRIQPPESFEVAGRRSQSNP
jgi:membrane peptidoglycan carboxypeptidase